MPGLGRPKIPLFATGLHVREDPSKDSLPALPYPRFAYELDLWGLFMILPYCDSMLAMSMPIKKLQEGLRSNVSLLPGLSTFSAAHR